MAVRYYYFDDHNQAHKMTGAKFNRIYESEESCPQFAGKKIKFVIAQVELENRKITSAKFLNFILTHFDNEGFVDATKRDDELFLSIEATSFGGLDFKGNVLNLNHKIAEKKLRQKYRWSPSDQEYQNLCDVVRREMNL